MVCAEQVADTIKKVSQSVKQNVEKNGILLMMIPIPLEHRYKTINMLQAHCSERKVRI